MYLGEYIRHNGTYAVFEGKTYGFNTSDLMLYGHGNKITIKDINQLESVYILETYGEVDGYSMQIWNYIKGKFTLEPSTKEMANHFGVGMEPDKCPSRFDAIFRSIEEIDSIYELRREVDNFPFNTERTVYLKMYGERIK